MEHDVDFREQEFHDAVREQIITLLLFILLHVVSYFTICYYKKRADREDLYGGEDGDAMVYRISVWSCTFTLATSGAAVLLLPLSVIGNEVLTMYPDSYYVKWLNSSLVHGMWNYVFLFTNLALFILMPFTYFFTESSGFTGSRKGILARVKETLVMLLLLAIMVFALAWVASAIIGQDKASKRTLFATWDVYLPYLYSWISFIGVFLLLLCTPVGFARLFTIVGTVVVKPNFLRDLDEELYKATFEENHLSERLHLRKRVGLGVSNGGHLSNGTLDLQTQLDKVRDSRRNLENRKRSSPWKRNLGYPLAMLALLILTGLCVVMVGMHSLELVFYRSDALPTSEHVEVVLGAASLSTFGVYGALVEIVVILYVLFASLAGLYSLPLFSRVVPRPSDTSLATVISNCTILLTLSSALPVLCRILGITNFDLLGSFGRLEWLSHYYLILAYNVAFTVASTFCLTVKFSAPVRQQMIYKFRLFFSSSCRREKNTSANTSFSSDISFSPSKDLSGIKSE